jgi:nucleoid-associated protein YgaU
MKSSRHPRKTSIPWLLALACLPLALDSCSSSSGGSIRGVPAQLPHIPIHASAATPSHSMSRGDYPFDSGGNYITAWAAEGAGRSGLNPGTDFSSWRSSHHDEGSRSRSRSSASRSKSSKSKTVAKSSKSRSSSARHTVKKGDTLSSIARRYGSSVSKIKAANGLKSDMIRDGRTLVVPK